MEEVTKQQKQAIATKYSVTLANIFQKLKNNGMKISQIRWFFLYLSRIDPRDIEHTRIQRIPVDEYTDILGIKRIDYKRLDESTTEMMQKSLLKFDKGNGFRKIIALTTCEFVPETYEVEMNCHDDIIPCISSLNLTEDERTTFSLGVVMFLSSPEKVHLYMIMREKKGKDEWRIKKDDFMTMLGLKTDSKAWNNFQQNTLTPFIEECRKNTDIIISYDTIRKGRGGRIDELIFIVTENKNFKNPLLKKELIKYLPADYEKKYSSNSEQKTIQIPALRESICHGLGRKEFDDLEDINQIKAIVLIARTVRPEILFEKHMKETNNVSLADDLATSEYIQLKILESKKYKPRKIETYILTTLKREMENRDKKEKKEAKEKKDEKSQSADEKKQYGQYNNVLLLDSEYSMLKNKFTDADEKIDNLSYYLHQHPERKYADHYAVIMDWAQKAQKKDSYERKGSYFVQSGKPLLSVAEYEAVAKPAPDEDDDDDGPPWHKKETKE